MPITTVYVDGVYDLFHSGHLSFLRKAKALGDQLTVGVINDQDVATYKPKPIIEHDDRVAMLEACRFVDRVIPNAPLYVDEAFLNQHGIDIMVHGDDTAYADYYELPIRLGIMRYVPYTATISSTEIRRRIISRQNEFEPPKHSGDDDV